MCLNDKQTEEIYNFATENKVFIMEAVWSRFMPVYKKLKELIESGRDPRTDYGLAQGGRSDNVALKGPWITGKRCNRNCPLCASHFWLSNNGYRAD